jgi:hypothetical protein
MSGEPAKMPNIFQLDDTKLIEKFIQGSNQLLASDRMRLEVNGAVSQLIARNGDPIAIMYLQQKPRSAIVKQNSLFVEILDRSLQNSGFVMTGDASRAGFIEYKYYLAPAGYQVFYTDPVILWKKWWPTERFQNKRRLNMDILVRLKDNWYPIQDIVVSGGNFTIKTIAGQILLQREGKVLWLAQNSAPEVTEKLDSTSSMATDVGSQKLAQQQSTLPTELDGEVSTHSPTSQQLKVQPSGGNEVLNSESTIIKDLKQKIAERDRLNAEMQKEINQLKHQYMVIRKRLEIVYKYLGKIGVKPQDIHSEK